MFRFEFEAIGTRWQIDLFQNLSSAQLQQLEKKVRKRIDDFDLVYSRFRAESLITEMSQKKGEFHFPNDSEKLFSFYKQLYDLTDGLFTPLIGQVLSDAGYDSTYSLKAKTLKTPDSWEKVLEYDNSKVTLLKPALLDFGAAGKGYLIDLVGELLQKNDVFSFCIDAGGDILYKVGGKVVSTLEPMRIGLENPINTEQIIGVVSLENKSICGSAGNRRTWGEFHHTINPKTLTSPQHILAIWVVADNTVLADGLSTALYFVPSEKLMRKFEFEYAILHADFSIEKSSDFPAEFFYNR